MTRAGHITNDYDAPFGGYSAADLRESANHLARLHDEAPRRRWPHRHCPPQVDWVTLAWVEHFLDALDLLEMVVTEWDQRGDGGCEKRIQDRVREALRGDE